MLALVAVGCPRSRESRYESWDHVDSDVKSLKAHRSKKASSLLQPSQLHCLDAGYMHGPNVIHIHPNAQNGNIPAHRISHQRHVSSDIKRKWLER